MFVIPSIYLWSLCSGLLAFVGMLIAHRFVKPIDLAQHQPSLDATLNIVGTLVSILLGLLVAASLTNYEALQTSIDAEAASASEIGRLSFGLPPITQKAIIETCADYCNQVVTDEWPLMKKGQSSEKALGAYVRLIKIIVTFKPVTNGESNLQNGLIASMQSLGDYRRSRILWLHNNWARNLLPVLIMCSLIVLIFAYLYVKRGALVLHGFLICFVAMALGANIGLLYVLSHPFSGDWQIQPKGFEFNMQLVKKYTTIR